MKNKKFKSLIKDYGGEIEKEDNKRIYVRVEEKSYFEVLRDLKQEGVTHLTAITGTDLGEKFEILYHLESGEGTLLNIRVEIGKDGSSLESVTDIFSGAVLYEREIMEMLGLKIENHPDPRRLFLADSWPENKHPLRKDQYNYSEIVKNETPKIKEYCEGENLSYQKLLKEEKEGKNRSGLKDWIKKQIDQKGGRK